MKGEQMKRFKRWVSVSVFAVALGVVLTAPIPTVAQAETLKELKAVAQADGLVVFRTGASETQQYRQANDKLEKIGIKIQLLSGSSTTLAAKEVASNAPVRHVSSLYVFSAHLRLRCVSWLHPVASSNTARSSHDHQPRYVCSGPCPRYNPHRQPLLLHPTL
jgi:hypothetical protein